MKHISETTPETYVCYRAATPIIVDGHHSDAPWKSAPWTGLFVDIEGDAKPLPRFATRAMMLWDDDWVWSLQGAINGHIPEIWVWVQFSAIAAGQGEEPFKT